MEDYYATLRVPRDASATEIGKAYRKLALDLHPDKNREDPQATEVFQYLAEAYGTLKDPTSRLDYDRKWKDSDFIAKQPRRPPTPAPGQIPKKHASRAFTPVAASATRTFTPGPFLRNFTTSFSRPQTNASQYIKNKKKRWSQHSDQVKEQVGKFARSSSIKLGHSSTTKVQDTSHEDEEMFKTARIKVKDGLNQAWHDCFDSKKTKKKKALEIEAAKLTFAGEVTSWKEAAIDRYHELRSGWNKRRELLYAGLSIDYRLVNNIDGYQHSLAKKVRDNLEAKAFPTETRRDGKEAQLEAQREAAYQQLRRDEEMASADKVKIDKELFDKENALIDGKVEYEHAKFRARTEGATVAVKLIYLGIKLFYAKNGMHPMKIETALELWHILQAMPESTTYTQKQLEVIKQYEEWVKGESTGSALDFNFPSPRLLKN